MNTTAGPQPDTVRDRPSLFRAEAPRPILALGLGNDILSDDAIGLLVARQLRRDLGEHPAIEVQETTEMGLALLDFLTGRHAVLLVDAIQTGAVPPGNLLELDPPRWESTVGRNPHFLGVGETLALGRQLRLPMPRQIKILAVEVADPFTLGTTLTPPVHAALPRAVDRARRLLAEWAAVCGGGNFAAPESISGQPAPDLAQVG